MQVFYKFLFRTFYLQVIYYLYVTINSMIKDEKVERLTKESNCYVRNLKKCIHK